MRILPGREGWPSILLRNAGRYDPDGPLDRAAAAGAWSAWRRAATTLGPQAVVRIISESGLRGRGGAGYPVGEKWRACGDTPTTGNRTVIANGIEADPGAQVDRTLMEQDPHGVVEGTAIAAYAVGAPQALIAVDASSTTAIRRLRAAVRAAEEAGYLGADVLGTGRDLAVEVRAVSGGFVVGEETALIRALESKRLQPEQRPPYPSSVGLWGKPSVVNNVQTLAAVPWILGNGAGAFIGTGSATDPGTTLVQVGGAVARPGIVEVPLETPLREILALAGEAPGARLKAVLVGGPTGGFLPTELLDTPLSPRSLQGAGAILGSRTLLAIDESACIVDVAMLMLRYSADEACGKTIPCRIGLRRLYEIVERVAAGTPRPTDGQLALDLAADVRDGGLCALEQTAPNPLLTGMRYFAQEFEDHILRSTCPAGVCQPLRVASALA